jgi:hypothetical protein
MNKSRVLILPLLAVALMIGGWLILGTFDQQAPSAAPSESEPFGNGYPDRIESDIAYEVTGGQVEAADTCQRRTFAGNDIDAMLGEPHTFSTGEPVQAWVEITDPATNLLITLEPHEHPEDLGWESTMHLPIPYTDNYPAGGALIQPGDYDLVAEGDVTVLLCPPDTHGIPTVIVAPDQRDRYTAEQQEPTAEPAPTLPPRQTPAPTVDRSDIPENCYLIFEVPEPLPYSFDAGTTLYARQGDVQIQYIRDQQWTEPVSLPRLDEYPAGLLLETEEVLLVTTGEGDDLVYCNEGLFPE